MNVSDLLFAFEYVGSYAKLKLFLGKDSFDMKWVKVAQWTLISSCSVCFLIWVFGFIGGKRHMLPYPAHVNEMLIFLTSISFIQFCVFTFTIIRVWRLFAGQEYLRKNELSMMAKLAISTLQLSGTAWITVEVEVIKTTLSGTWVSNSELGAYILNVIRIGIGLACVEIVTFAFSGSYFWWLTTLDVRAF